MYDLDTRKRALALIGQGRSLNSVSRQIGISRAAIREWQTRLEPLRDSECLRCGPEPALPQDTTAYTYLLGLYLGDGCISTGPRHVHRLRIFCADAWPGLIESCATAMRQVLPQNTVGRVKKQGCVEVGSFSKHWPCLFPQHGSGRKHERRIALEPWQQQLVEEHPWELVRGLIHSDGCRMTNWTTRVVGGERKRYEYPRYFFTNTSADIIRLFTDTLDGLGVEWKHARQRRKAQMISIARRASVALMDEHVGPKH
ncbi:transcriptional regulator [Streptomyces gobiensis]|uniref:transcriptional regulator n=1 Tax=Streptomyces gobiensis TaxID=2875706 RepID=UPI001E4C6AD2|nr:transcriptional regulator [Streptomyces gobiensis]UGY90806.1 transcriptional regulator [Streptomyces gobiensis]